MTTGRARLERKIHAALCTLGATPELVAERNLPMFADAADLVVAERSAGGRAHLLIRRAAEQWVAMRDAAAHDGVALIVISAFRGFDRQQELLKHRVESGHDIARVLAVAAPAGCSEHHTGRAIDVGTPGCEPLSLAFAETAAFHWLAASAAKFGFSLSYPEGNRWGFAYEPWHWCYGREELYRAPQ